MVWCHSATHPSENLLIPADIDRALRTFLIIFLDLYIVPYCAKIATDSVLVDEVKCEIRYALASLIRRLRTVDFGNIVLEKILPIIARHVEVFLMAATSMDAPQTSALLERATLDRHAVRLLLSRGPLEALGKLLSRRGFRR